MSDGNNDVLILLAAAGAYLYFKRGQGVAPVAVNQGYQGGVATMPGSVGAGNNQVKTGAILGFLQAISGALGPNTSSGYVQGPNYPANYGAINDIVIDPWSAGGVIDNTMY